MDRITLDFETYYDKDYSLRKMTPIQYCLDERWETIGCSVKINGGEAVWLPGDQVADYLRGLDAPYAAISHNGLFDFIVLAFRYGIHPALLIDTMGMARALVSHATPRGSVSLETVARHLGLGIKGKTVHNVIGMRSADIERAGLMPAYAAYCCNDADLCWGIYAELKDGFSAEEFIINDMLLRMASQPQFTLDVDKLYAHLGQVQADKQTLLDRVGLEKSELMSDDKFAVALERLGVVPTKKLSEKKSATAGHEVFTYAFAKTDPQMVALEEHPDPDVQALVAARLGHKSTIEETRTQRFIDISKVTFDGNESWMPIALRMSGAHTHRFCLVGSTLIAVLRDNLVVYIPMEQLLCSDLIWDGAVFVPHGGLVYAGTKEVIEYDGITGTPDHRVWTVEHGYRPLAEAKAGGYNIARGNVPDRTRIAPPMLRADYVLDAHQDKRALRAGEPPVGDQTRAGAQPILKPTWDIVGCGPRNRFMANGRIVHNSGDWKLNQQNLPSRNGTMLRQSLTAPAGHVVMTVDAAQIEARLTAWICKEAGLVAAFANGDDIYSMFASDIYGFPVNKKDHPTQRFLGKTSVLGLGFNMGGPKFQNTVRVQAAQNHVDIEIDLEEAKRVVGLYRSKYRNIAQTWGRLNDLIPLMKNGQADGMTFGPMTFEKGAILGPNGLRLFYDELQYKDRQWTYYHGGKRKFIYGGKLLENIIQFLDRVCVMDAAVRIKQRVRHERLPLAHQLHDELVYVPRLEFAPVLRQIMMEEMCRRPVWGPDLPLAAEVGQGPNYGAAK